MNAGRTALVGAALALAGCAAQPPAPQAAADGSSWVLTTLDGAPGPRASLSFSGARASGVGPCNRFMADLAREADGLFIGPLVATRMACPEMAEEERFFGALTDVAQAEERDGALVLRDADGAELMRFKPGV